MNYLLLFLDKAKKVHGNKYDYSEVEYKGFNTKVKIICKEHGEFFQTPHNHLKGQGCPICKGKLSGFFTDVQYTQEEFQKEVIAVHGRIWDTSETVFKGMLEPITVKCCLDGEFTLTAYDFLVRKKGCPECFIRRKGKEVQPGNGSKFWSQRLWKDGFLRKGDHPDYNLSEDNRKLDYSEQLEKLDIFVSNFKKVREQFLPQYKKSIKQDF